MGSLGSTGGEVGRLFLSSEVEAEVATYAQLEPRRITESCVQNCRSRSVAVVIPQQSAQSLPARNVAGPAAHLFPRLDQLIAKTLMVALHEKMTREFRCGNLQRPLAEEDHAIQALLLR